MKRIVVGMLLAAVAWMIGTQFHPWYCQWVGLAFGFISGLILEDWRVTKEVAGKTWQNIMYFKQNYKWDWKGAFIHMGTIFCLVVSIAGWFTLLLLSLDFLGGGGKLNESLLSCTKTVLALMSVFLVMSWLLPIMDAEAQDYCENIHTTKIVTGNILHYCFLLNPVSVLCFWLPYGIIRYAVPCIFRLFMKIPGVLWRFGQFLFYTTIELVAREKTLTFAICVTAGAGIGMYLGKTIFCGLAASALAGALILVSDWTRELAKQKLAMLKQNT
jgi:hypothetical protein